jgi:hypothetical protein
LSRISCCALSERVEESGARPLNAGHVGR